MYSVYIKNPSTTDTINYQGQDILPEQYELVPSNRLGAWQSDPTLLVDIANSIAIVAKADDGSNDITDINLAINYLKDIPNDMDDSGRVFNRPAATDKGWAYLAQPIEFTTCKDNSVYSKDWKGDNRGSCYLRFYDSNDNEIVDEIDNDDPQITYADKQDHIDSKCEITKLTIDLDMDFDIVSGMLEQFKAPKDQNDVLQDVRFWVLIGIFDQNQDPFDPDGPGTTWTEQVTEFVGGINLKFFNENQEIKTDGRAGKKLFKIVNDQIPFNQNQIQFIIKHPIGFQHSLMPILEYYRKITL